MNETFYYTAPSDAVLDEVKIISIGIWQTYDDTYGYVSQKIDQIKDIPNVKDNFMYIVAMFDPYNQQRLGAALSNEALQAINDRIVAGGGSPIFTHSNDY